jgi:hypothetical protein
VRGASRFRTSIDRQALPTSASAAAAESADARANRLESIALYMTTSASAGALLDASAAGAEDSADVVRH